MLQDAYEVLQHWTAAGIDVQREDETAVVAALSFWDYSLIATSPGSEAYKATGRCFSVASGRISFTYALKGGLHALQPENLCACCPKCRCHTMAAFPDVHEWALPQASLTQ